MVLTYINKHCVRHYTKLVLEFIFHIPENFQNIRVSNNTIAINYKIN